MYNIQDVCPDGMFGKDCTEACHCPGEAPCEKEAGYCTASNGTCATGYITDTKRDSYCNLCE